MKKSSLTKITFKADDDTLDAIEKLVTSMNAEARYGVKLARSSAIRRALIESAERLLQRQR